MFYSLDKALSYGIQVLCTFLLDYLGIYCLATPYELYSEFDFNIPVGRHGDCYDRYLIRIEELRESCRIIEQVIPKILPLDYQPIKIENYKITSPSS